MALRHASWLLAVLTLAVLVFHIRPPAGRTTAPAATDVLFVFDTTGSMAGALTEAQAQAAQVMSSLSGRLPNLKFGVAQVRDYGSTRVWGVEQAITANQGTVQSAIDALSADEGPHDDDLNAGVPADIVNQPSPWNTGVDPGPGGDGIDWQQELASFKGA